MNNNKLVSAKHYVNLYHHSIRVLKDIISNTNRNKMIICSNCISLIAGLTFYVLQNHKIDYEVFYSINNLENSNKKLVFILDKKDNIIDQIDFNIYFYYDGEEQNILCI